MRPATESHQPQRTVKDNMDLTFSPADQEFRARVRDWLAVHTPRQPRPEDGLAMREFDLAWQRAKFAGGWGGIAWPKEYGGAGLSAVHQMIWYEECARANAPGVGCLSITLNHAGPTVVAFGTPDQKAFHLPRILGGEVLWCQGFSEPGAGSDLASLALRAEVRGDHLVLNGQKIWTSHAHLADFQETLVRTDASGPKHRGITWLIVDMRAPGITIRPIETLLPGYRHFCEVFYDEVRVPLSNVVGAIDQGWKVAMSTLAFERGDTAVSSALEMTRILDELLELARHTRDARGRPLIENETIAAQLAQHRADAAALRAMGYGAVSRARGDKPPGPESAMVFLHFGELLQRVRATGMEILGADALALAGEGGGWPNRFLTDRMFVIAGGSAEVRRNIIAERMLGLPRSY